MKKTSVEEKHQQFELSFEMFSVCGQNYKPPVHNHILDNYCLFLLCVDIYTIENFRNQLNFFLTTPSNFLSFLN